MSHKSGHSSNHLNVKTNNKTHLIRLDWKNTPELLSENIELCELVNIEQVIENGETYCVM